MADTVIASQIPHTVASPLPRIPSDAPVVEAGTGRSFIAQVSSNPFFSAVNRIPRTLWYPADVSL